jgi:hypothetical protein
MAGGAVGVLVAPAVGLPSVKTAVATAASAVNVVPAIQSGRRVRVGAFDMMVFLTVFRRKTEMASPCAAQDARNGSKGVNGEASARMGRGHAPLGKERTNRNGGVGTKAGSWATSEKSWNLWETVWSTTLGEYLRSDRYDIWHNVPSSQGPVKHFIIDRYEKDDGDKRGHVTLAQRRPDLPGRRPQATWPTAVVRP